MVERKQLSVDQLSLAGHLVGSLPTETLGLRISFRESSQKIDVENFSQRISGRDSFRENIFMNILLSENIKIR